MNEDEKPTLRLDRAYRCTTCDAVYLFPHEKEEHCRDTDHKEFIEILL
ncbi:zinc finger domain-containing protein [Candidatus Nitrososphaera gargensis Ga9.2]|uniref:Zinc finger domain-containing protein n=1 Tax=Nitrososphaera gargensis (strain Ga9.2) TaxID=1237085 RepID=K0II99_NITGG|nr:hypothetical protein [Candidatus Nitrososphaera gargensis]AFU57717.1 zinc finger domain-containing protein [Candidatus Nitrososphaera gargensis Ga9.2]